MRKQGKLLVKLYFEYIKKEKLLCFKELECETTDFTRARNLLSSDKEKSFDQLETTREEAGAKLMPHIHHYIESI